MVRAYRKRKIISIPTFSRLRQSELWQRLAKVVSHNENNTLFPFIPGILWMTFISLRTIPKKKHFDVVNWTLVDMFALRFHHFNSDFVFFFLLTVVSLFRSLTGKSYRYKNDVLQTKFSVFIVTKKNHKSPEGFVSRKKKCAHPTDIYECGRETLSLAGYNFDLFA